MDVISLSSGQPFAWFGTGISGLVGQPVPFNAKVSYDPRGLRIDSYEWDFDRDGTFEISTNKESIQHTYASELDGFVILRVRKAGGFSLASARTITKKEISQITGQCPLDENVISIIASESGELLSCIATKPPTEDAPGMFEATDPKTLITFALDALVEATKPFPKEVTDLAELLRRSVQKGMPMSLICVTLEAIRVLIVPLDCALTTLNINCGLPDNARNVVETIDFLKPPFDCPASQA